MQDRMSIPIRRNYNELFKDFQIQKIKSMSKDNLINELQNPESWIYELMKDDAISLFLNTGGFLNTGITNDDLYKLGVDTTIKQISKRCFFSEIEDYDLILKKIKSRIVNNIRNYFSPLRRNSYLNINKYLLTIEEETEPFDRILDEIDLMKIDKETIKNGLSKVWKNAITDSDFDIVDFEELCSKFQFQLNEVLGYAPNIIPLMTKESCNNGNYQLVLIFELEEVL
ncbi:hypothetical protein N5U04_06685 [Aliarcobacter butzleri]|uniref:hypothetical protein n=1 Tax=Aliarcobacter butzleri TaxID=28197 RepID=UPI0021B3EDD2|nr:hypothetical protein [Aliarcobacter butzleri]MCT7550924.1 hypothetical protein [Aliarcobacter butzleri]MCT7559250.1 hypothetical protein [Aliarcobacter butzleri]